MMIILKAKKSIVKVYLNHVKKHISQYVDINKMELNKLITMGAILA